MSTSQRTRELAQRQTRQAEHDARAANQHHHRSEWTKPNTPHVTAPIMPIDPMTQTDHTDNQQIA